MNKKVVKFGGSSVSSASQILKVKKILESDVNRKYIIVSAPGKRKSNDEKITDMLIQCFDLKKDLQNQNAIFEKIKNRYNEIITDLNIDFDIEKEIDNIKTISNNNKTFDYLISRGEYLNAKIISIFLNCHFLDMENVIIFNDDKKVDFDITYKNIKSEIEKLEKIDNNKKIIIPGFYGSNKNGEITTFSRGGSDITGALVARALGAIVYENWTDVSGVMFEDPRIVENVKPIEYITYSELRELSYMGASVLHEETLYPVSTANIPVHILNTNNPTDLGTMIVSTIPKDLLNTKKRKTVTGIAGKKGFTSIMLRKALMNEEVGFLVKLLNIFYEDNISVEHCPTGIDTISVVLRSDLINNKKDKIISKINSILNPDELSVVDNLSLIAIVGEEMINSKSITSNVFDIFRDEKILIKMIDYGSSGNNIIVAVDDKDYAKSLIALNKLYEE